jgi:glyoxylase-like metal-dependent hydrolase (beta-lactamase superfamily II)
VSASIRVDAYELGTFREGASPRVVMGFVVHHRDGVIVVDTGFGFGHPELDLQYDVRARRIHDALASVEVRPTDVTGIINCHLHADHSGQNLVFPGIPIWVQPAEWAAAHTPDHTVVEWIDFDGADVRERDGDHQVIPGVRILATPGHTPGHQSVAIDTADGLVVLAGQACYTAGEWDGDPDALEGRSSAPDVAAYDRSIQRLRDLTPARVLFGHDRAAWHAPVTG